ncbi:glucokinase [Bradyrhizobium sp. USDA 4452]
MSSGRSANEQILFADIGGTNARFALAEHGEIGPIEHFKVADFPGAKEAIATFLAHRAAGALTTAVLGVAGPVENDHCTITYSRWVIDGADLQTRFGFRTIHLLNDFEAMAWSLPALQPFDLFAIGHERPTAGAPMLVVGPGTGFGAACFFPDAPLVAVTEAGHTTLPAISEREERVIGQLRRHFGHVSVERALSGAGLVNLYQALAVIDGVAVPERSPAAITQAALNRSCDVCRSALDMFCSLLGTVAGDLALTFCARGGVYIAGGIVPRFADRLAESRFRTQFESKGRYEPYLRRLPVSVVLNPDSSFTGLKAFMEQTPAASRPSALRIMS